MDRPLSQQPWQWPGWRLWCEGQPALRRAVSFHRSAGVCVSGVTAPSHSAPPAPAITCSVGGWRFGAWDEQAIGVTAARQQVGSSRRAAACWQHLAARSPLLLLLAGLAWPALTNRCNCSRAHTCRPAGGPVLPQRRLAAAAFGGDGLTVAPCFAPLCVHPCPQPCRLRRGRTAGSRRSPVSPSSAATGAASWLTWQAGSR